MKPGIQKSSKRAEFETTTAEVLRKADLRVSPYLMNITLLNFLVPKKNIDIHSGYVLNLLVACLKMVADYYGLPVLVTHLVVCFFECVNHFNYKI